MRLSQQALTDAAVGYAEVEADRTAVKPPSGRFPAAILITDGAAGLLSGTSLLGRLETDLSRLHPLGGELLSLVG